jgi:methyl-accepting chemotaxis protein
MKLTDLKLSSQLGIGFGALVAITVLLGSIATINMFRASSLASSLSEEQVPMVSSANGIERNSLLTMYNMRGYAYTQEADYYDAMRSYLAEIRTNLAAAKNLAETKNIAELRNNVARAEQQLANYETLARQTHETNQKIQGSIDKMNEAANEFVSNAAAFISDQHTALRRDIGNAASRNTLQEREHKIEMMNNIVDKGNYLRIANYRAQAQRNPESFRLAISSFSIADEMQSLRRVTVLAEHIRELNTIESATSAYLVAMNGYIELWLERERLDAARNEAANHVLAAAQDAALMGINATTSAAASIDASLTRSSGIMIIGLIVAVIIALIFAVVITRSIVSGIVKGVGFAEKISGGDLTAEVDSETISRKDEVGVLARSLDSMVQKLREVISSVISSSDNIASASQQMSSGSQQVSQGASEQASSAEEVSSSMEQMASNIQQNTDNAQQADKISMKVSDGVQKVGAASRESLSSIKNIAEKIKIINDIAFQTNILALNAAVEAARAGEHGKGFAVVAAEVRKLAERSKIAADEIAVLSTGSVSVTENASELMEGLIPEIEKTAKLVQEIAVASMEQTSGANQVNTAIQQLNEVTQLNAAASEEMATSAEELNSQAEQLKEVIGFFRIDDTGRKSGYAAAPIAQRPKSAQQAKPKTAVKQVQKTAKQTAGVALDMGGGKFGAGAQDDKMFESF